MRKNVVIVAILIFLVVDIGEAQFLLGFMGKHTVEMRNALSKGKRVRIHCKSKNNDLGEHVISKDKTYSFTFKPNILGGTKFFCGFTFDRTLHWFNIYDQNRDFNKCKEGSCKWEIKDSGPCFFDWEKKGYNQCSKWDEKQH